MSEHRNREHIRIDFATTVLSTDDDTRLMTLLLEPDPRRYDRTEIDGETRWTDKFLGYTFGTEVLQETAVQGIGLPVSYSPARIGKSEEYAEERRAAVAGEHEGQGYLSPTKTPAMGQRLSAHPEETPITFVSVDIVGSTAMRGQHGTRYDAARRVFIRELAMVVGQFNGSILKLTGDGFIAFFNDLSINAQADACPDCCLTLLGVLHSAVNKAAREHSLPEFSIRIGADHGLAKVSYLEVPEVGLAEIDIESDAINRAVKLQEAAPVDGVLLGRDLYTKLHVNWLTRSARSEDITGFGSTPYKTYVLS